ncbi:TetR family transcriptional regulator [Actinotignum urinale]|uniref:TetR family transcriptional regulator n=1 Tax=Actinotignum urinale TaxID=190146 RepID=A0AAW9HVU2_9ACTO|nr:TetR family transcriptional regulator [Actinotignum urinale]MDY5128835.1 TetR family transcriptional regulator [Actinotignum urinale]MDY5133305.1 TetR family transcriptional regulator [Actinotignum urinale]MDY5152122.1 TetR family transcriptional regulator [Actinotignum urinale]MDY5154540.1 TetR family transcriptional regulator [Actinotignum urinale]WIK58968.1 TetR family transcriptional regulator [Actinotignum urinale]
MERKHGKKVGRKQRFNADDVIKAATEVGVHDFTMTEIANKIGVAAPAVYRLYDGRQAVVDAVVKRAAEEMPVTSTELPWKEAVETFISNYRETLTKYPGLAEEILGNPISALYFARQWETLTKALENSGFSVEGSASFAIQITSDTTARFVLEQLIPTVQDYQLELIEKTGPTFIEFLEHARDNIGQALDAADEVATQWSEYIHQK